MKMKEENVFKKLDKDFERRNHGCDGCRKRVSTERFDGYCGSHLWLCSKCYKKIVSNKLIQKSKE